MQQYGSAKGKEKDGQQPNRLALFGQRALGGTKGVGGDKAGGGGGRIILKGVGGGGGLEPKTSKSLYQKQPNEYFLL